MRYHVSYQDITARHFRAFFFMEEEEAMMVKEIFSLAEICW
jgi:hypothetical protein